MQTNTNFKNEIKILNGAGVGVVLVPTREPHRAARAIRATAYEKGVDFREWNCRDGWTAYLEHGEIDKQNSIPVGDPYEALRAIGDVGDPNRAKAWGDGFYTMHYPHWVMPRMPAMIQCIKEYSVEFTATGQRLFLLVPEGFELPEELQHDIPSAEFPLPTYEELRDSFEEIVNASFDPETTEPEHRVAPFSEAEIKTIVSNATGMTESEATNAFSRAIIENRESWPKTTFEPFNRVLLSAKTDVVKRSKVLSMIPTTDFSMVGGLDRFKKFIEVRRGAFTSEAKEFGCDTPKGILAVGPPGTGKSILAKALAGELGLPLLGMDIGRLMGGIVGESEKNTRSALSQIKAMAPCCVLLDEVDKGLGGAHKASGDSGTTSRVLGTILTFMSECDVPVFFILTANRVSTLPPELIRPGRVDQNFCVTLPNIVERMEILKIHLVKRQQDPETIDDLILAAEASRGYVGSEIECAVKEAVLQSYTFKLPLSGKLIAEQLDEIQPLSVSFAKEMEEMNEWATANARLTSTPCEDAEEVKPGTTKKPTRRRLGVAPTRPIRKGGK